MSYLSDTQDLPTLAKRECPKCQSWLPVYQNYPIWCAQCNWNLQPFQATRPRNVFETIYAKLGHQLSKQLFEDMVKRGLVKPRLTPAKFLAYLLATFIHSLTLLLAVLGIVITILGWPFPMAIFVGLSLLVIAWFLRPRRYKISEEDIVTRANFPALYALVDKVALAIGTSTVDIIKVDERFNAAITQFGWRRKKKVLFLGLPLLTILTNEERVALLAHELGHCVNGDPQRGFFIRTALNSLIEWYRLLYPSQLGSRRSNQGITLVISKAFTNLLLFGVTKLIRLGIGGLSHLVWRESQYAEYLADAKAAQVGGTEAKVSVLEKLHFRDTYNLAVQQVSLNWKNANLFEELHKQMAQVPAHELERIKRIRQLDGSRLDVTHPPTSYRIQFLLSHSVSGAKIKLSQEAAAQLEQELVSMQRDIQAKIIDKHLDKLYRR